MGVQINQLSVTDVAAGLTFPVWDPSKGDTRKVIISELLDWIWSSINQIGKPVTRYSAPSATGFSVDIDAGTYGSDDVHLILTPGGAYADGEIVLPLSATCVDQQVVVVNCTQAVATLVVDANGATGVFGAPTALLTNGFFTLQYDVSTSAWYRIG